MNTTISKPKVISAMEARRNFGSLMNKVSLMGDIYVIKRAGKPLVKVSPINDPINKNDPFGNPFITFSEWEDESNDIYNEL